MNTNPHCKKILCFGDSLTWGYIPASNGVRFPADQRWTWILQNLLSDTYEVLEEGLNSRTIDSEDPRPEKVWKNGSKYLIPCLETHKTIDLLILMLGTNECKYFFDRQAKEIGKMLEIKIILPILSTPWVFRENTPKILLLSPPVVNDTNEHAQIMYQEATQKMRELWNLYSKIALKYDCDFLETSTFLQVWADGVHIDAENNRLLAHKIYEKINFNS